MSNVAARLLASNLGKSVQTVEGELVSHPCGFEIASFWEFRPRKLATCLQEFLEGRCRCDKKPETIGGRQHISRKAGSDVDLKYELVQLGRNIDWDRMDREIPALYSDKGRRDCAS